MLYLRLFRVIWPNVWTLQAAVGLVSVSNMGSLELQVQVAQAVHILNHDTHSVNRVAANQWLVQFQSTDAAWEVATSILAMDSSPTNDLEVELFAGQVLKRKVRFWIVTSSICAL